MKVLLQHTFYKFGDNNPVKIWIIDLGNPGTWDKAGDPGWTLPTVECCASHQPLPEAYRIEATVTIVYDEPGESHDVEK